MRGCSGVATFGADTGLWLLEAARPGPARNRSGNQPKLRDLPVW